MKGSYDLILRGGTCVTATRTGRIDIAVRHGRIAALGDLTGARAAEELDVRNLHVLPGVIDSQVHFREPGLTHKEDLESGTRGAALGGVTAIFEMPNTHPSTTTRAALEQKLALAAGRTWVDHAFFVGASSDNADQLGELERLPGCAGVKVFLGSSTGSLLVDDAAVLRRVLRSGRRRVAIHAEDEARLRERRALVSGPHASVHAHPEWRDAESARLATEQVLALAKREGRPLHILHISTADELPLLEAYRDLATVEVTPQHLTLAAPDCYDRLGSYAQMNPPIRDEEHQAALWVALEQGLVDVIGSDHAPHTSAEKDRPYPESPSGMPGVQTLVPVMLTHVNAGKLSLERFVELTSAGPARVYDVAGKGRIAIGYDADFTIVDLHKRVRLSDSWIASRAGWTPFDGMEAQGFPLLTVVRGALVMREGELLGAPRGQPVRFVTALSRD
ncbi:MAG: dihydroorotase [Myxococcaceae bacterium]|nr:dihydroorotase [Myxococcaceae bacterium]